MTDRTPLPRHRAAPRPAIPPTRAVALAGAFAALATLGLTGSPDPGCASVGDTGICAAVPEAGEPGRSGRNDPRSTGGVAALAALGAAPVEGWRGGRNDPRAVVPQRESARFVGMPDREGGWRAGRNAGRG